MNEDELYTNLKHISERLGKIEQHTERPMVGGGVFLFLSIVALCFFGLKAFQMWQKPVVIERPIVPAVILAKEFEEGNICGAQAILLFQREKKVMSTLTLKQVRERSVQIRRGMYLKVKEFELPDPPKPIVPTPQHPESTEALREE